VNKIKCAGVVVVYNPDVNVLRNIRTYLDDLSFLIVVDNSDTPDMKLIARIQKTDKLLYVSNNGNRGIAAALNTGAEYALRKKCDYLLTMDQDSCATKGMLKRMLSFLKTADDGSIGILSPAHDDNRHITLKADSQPVDVATVMTSGNLLSLAAFQAAGPFLEKLFIDYVDIEYCLRLRSAGFRILRYNEARLLHRLGNTFRFSFMGITGYTTNHNPLRRYYISRNRWYVVSRYFLRFPGVCWRIVKGEIKDVIKILIWERQRGRKLLMTLAGFADFLRGRYGNYQS
jgi:rhamnosyltransferase